MFHNAETNLYARANAKVVENCRFYIENTDVRDDRDSFYWNIGELCRAVLHYGAKGDIAPGRLSPEAEAAFREMAFGYCHDISKLADAACDGTKTWRVYESENHHVQRASALWQLMHVLLKIDPAYGARTLADGGTLRAHYEALAHRADECVGCRGCENRCPFGVRVAERMEKTAKLFG